MIADAAAFSPNHSAFIGQGEAAFMAFIQIVPIVLSLTLCLVKVALSASSSSNR
jgi:hypothetical protein